MNTSLFANFFNPNGNNYVRVGANNAYQGYYNNAPAYSGYGQQPQQQQQQQVDAFSSYWPGSQGGQGSYGYPAGGYGYGYRPFFRPRPIFNFNFNILRDNAFNLRDSVFSIGLGRHLGQRVPKGQGRMEMNGVIDRIKNGDPFFVDFDLENVANDKDVFEGRERDQLGNLAGGETYQVRFQNGGFTTTGFQENNGSTGTFTYFNGNVDGGQVSLWGRVFNIREDATGGILVEDPELGDVGHLRFV